MGIVSFESENFDYAPILEIWRNSRAVTPNEMLLVKMRKYVTEDFEGPLSFVQMKQNGDNGVTYMNRSIGLIRKMCNGYK